MTGLCHKVQFLNGIILIHWTAADQLLIYKFDKDRILSDCFAKVWAANKFHLLVFGSYSAWLLTPKNITKVNS